MSTLDAVPVPPVEADDPHSLMPVFLALARRRWLLLGVPALATAVVLVLNLTGTPIYSATARILPPQYNTATVNAMQNQPGGESQIGNSALTLKNPTDLFVGILMSRTILDAIIEKEQLAGYYHSNVPDDLRRMLLAATDIRAGKDGIVSVSVEDRDPTRAAGLANAYVDEFYAFASSLAKQQARLRSTFYDSALHSAQARLASADEALRASEAETGFTRLHGQDEAIVQSAAELQAQIAARETQLRTMLSYATETNPDVRLLRRELANLHTELAGLNATLAPSPDRAPANGHPPFVGIGRVPAELMRAGALKRDVQYWESIVMLLGKYAELGKIDETRDLSLFQVLDRAVPAQRKSRPRTTINVILTAVGSGTLSLIIALALEYVARRRRVSASFDAHWQLLISTLLPRRVLRWWARVAR